MMLISSPLAKLAGNGESFKALMVALVGKIVLFDMHMQLIEVILIPYK